MFVPKATEPDEVIDGRQHFWLSKPGMTPTEDLYFVKVVIPPGKGHSFHTHPNKEEVIFILSGRAEQWLEDKMKILGPGDSLYVPKSAPHATYNTGDEDLIFLAVITPGTAEGEMAIDISQEEPWASIRK